MSVRDRRTPTLVVSMAAVARAVVLSIAGIALVALVATGVLGRLAGGTTVAAPAVVAAQQDAAVRDIDRGYVQNVEQVKKVRALKLAIPNAQADAIANKALADLATLRHSAILSLAQLVGTAPDPEAYAKVTEQALDAAHGQAQPSVPPVLLTPRLYAIVARFDQLAAAISDRATTDLTQPAGASPPSGGRPSPTPSPTR